MAFAEVEIIPSGSGASCKALQAPFKTRRVPTIKMADVSTTTPSPHKRSRSAVLKSLVMPSSRTPSPTKGSPAKGHSRSQTVDVGTPSARLDTNKLLPFDHPHSRQPAHAVQRENSNWKISSPTKSPLKTGHNTNAPQDGRERSSSPTKRKQPHGLPKEKENATPPSSGVTETRPPIWAQFATSSNESSLNTPLPSSPTKQQHNPSTRPQPYSATPRASSTRDFAQAKSSANSSLSSMDARTHRIWDEGSERPSSKSSASSMGSDKVGKVAAAVAIFNGKTCDSARPPPFKQEDLDSAFEAVLSRRNVPETMRTTMRNLDPVIKADFIRHASEDEPQKEEEDKPEKNNIWSTFRRGRAKSTADKQKPDADGGSSPSKRNRSRSRGRNVSTKDGDGASPTKRGRSNSRPRSLFSLRNLSSSSVNRVGLDGTAESKEGPLSPRPGDSSDPFRRPADFIEYLHMPTQVQDVEVGKLKKLRVLLRNESVSWVDTFILKGGMDRLLLLLARLRAVEWRQDHEDMLLHELLLCLKGLCTTQRALNKLAEKASTLFPNLLAMLFDEERRGPSEFSTRGIVINLLFIHLSSAEPQIKASRARTVLSYLADPLPPQQERPPEFVLGMTKSRPYQKWCKEIRNVTQEVFWIFIHFGNVIALPSESDQHSASRETAKPYLERHFPKARAPEALNPWVGGVEWEATNYLAAHMDLVNGLLASLQTKAERNQVREELRASGFEKTISSLRLCKEKFYPAPHETMKEWVAAAVEDDWEVDDVRQSQKGVESASSPTKSPSKDSKPPPKLELPVFETPGDGRL